ncbi:MAG: hypothetical protein DWQ36_15375 [Acidobacteria bacterium]|nr:MAG: hypothetical protein DWQ30_07980 [Acidobacteriota bacterium]REK05889.1 MAG: hypothetical protein DWQ36_15375 [Acidobacteriota bacterium]
MSDEQTTERPSGGADFFIGYSSRRSPAQRRFLRSAASVSVTAAAILALALAAAQPSSDPGVFEYGRVRTLEATVLEASGALVLGGLQPVDGERLPAMPGPSLVSRPGKHGAEQLLDPFAGRRVVLSGTLVHSPAGSMVEISGPPQARRPQEAALASSASAEPRPEPDGTGTQVVELIGEIVDSKCLLGVMKPGRGARHRACAVRCISGGVPAALLTREEHGGRLYVLRGEAGEPLSSELLDRVGVPVRVRGRVTREGDLWLLRTAAASIDAL